MRLIGHGEGDAFGSLNDNRMRVAERKLQAVALQSSTVANANELELLLEALGNANNHVVDERTG